MKKLAMEELAGDPRVDQARRLLVQAVGEKSRTLTAVRPADPERKITYDQLLAKFGEARGGNLYFPYLGAGLGHGPFVELADGSVKFDMISGIGVHHFGHSHPKLVEASVDAALRDTVMQGNLQQNVESVAVADALLQKAKPGSQLAHCFLTSSGAMANENGLKLAFHKKGNATRMMAFAHTFAGRTMALSSVTDKAAYRIGLPATLQVDYVPFFDPKDPAGSTTRAVETIRDQAKRFPGQHAAIWCELVLGEGGFYPGTREFFTAICTEARAQKIFIVADEVQTFGRTSKLFAFQHFGLENLVDIVTVGKMLQLCATIFTDALKPAPGIVSQTFTASTSALFAAQTILRDLLSDDLFGEHGRNMKVHAKLVERFEAIATRHPGWVRGPYGIGGMFAFQPFDGAEDKAKKILATLYEAGVIAFYNGGSPTRIRMLPPIPALTDAHIDTVTDIIEATLAKLAPTFAG